VGDHDFRLAEVTRYAVPFDSPDVPGRHHILGLGLNERQKGGRSSFKVRMRVKVYVQLICLSALLIGALVWHFFPVDPESNISVLITLALLALTAEYMSYLLPRGATSSISFVPFLTTVFLVPNVAALIAIVAAGSMAQLSKRKDGLKLLFNCCQLAVSYGCAITVYRLLGGQSFFALTHLGVAQATMTVGVQMTLTYLIVFALNGLLVSSVIALAGNTKTLHVWR
jgi:hypothetical protein